MMANGRHAIDIEFRVMDLVHSPQQRRFVQEPMQRVLRQIDQQHRCDERQPRRSCQDVEEPKATLYGEHRHRDSEQGEADARNRVADARQREIIDPAKRRGGCQRAPRPEGLPERDGRKCADEQV